MSYQSLYIGYAPVSCTTEKIKKEFDTYLNCSIVSKVDERIKYELKTGKPYKIFFIHFDWINPPLEKLFQELSEKESTNVNKWIVKFNTRLRDTHITHSPIAIKDDDYWMVLANSFKN
jgi:hypothetical protein